MAQNEMKAKPALPERVRSMEGLGGTLCDPKCWFRRDGTRHRVCCYRDRESRRHSSWRGTGPQPWQALALATVRESGLMSRTHTLSAFRHECNHLPISWIVGLTIVWLADYEERARTTFAVPTGPWLLWLAKPKFVSEALHQCVVERERSLEVADAHEDV